MVRRTPATTYYYIVMFKDCEGEVSFEAVDLKQKKSRFEALYKDAKEAYKEWSAAKKEAGEGFDDPKPKKPACKTFKKVKGKAKADVELARLKERYDAYLAKNQAKDTEVDELTDDLPDDPEPKKAEPKAAK